MLGETLLRLHWTVMLELVPSCFNVFRAEVLAVFREDAGSNQVGNLMIVPSAKSINL